MNVVVAATVSGTAGRDYLSGIFEYTNTGRRWTLEIVDDIGSLDKRLKYGNRPDGVLVVFPHQELTRASLLHFTMPTVIVDFPPPDFVDGMGTVSFVHMNEERIGIAAAEHLLSRGNFNAFACIIDEPQFRYPTERARGFDKCLAATGKTVKTLIVPDVNPTERDLEIFRQQLARLPRPLGVFAVRDRAARKVYDACRRLGITIPDELAIVGVDNDVLFCTTLSVTLSSVCPDHHKVGFLAARELNGLLRGGPASEKIFEKSVLGVEQRASTRIIPPTARIIAEALAFIERNASGALRVSDVASHLGISRRLADLRFRQIRGETLLDAIVRVRLEKIQKQLSSSEVPLAQIARVTGFSSPAVFSRFFRTHVGMTPNAWRQRNRK